MIYTKESNSKFGFTLVELSIVLVIIGLLIGGVLIGNSLVKSAKIKTIVSKISQYQILVDRFDEVYKSLPGDLPNATSYWSGTMNGNGDGMIAHGLTAWTATGQEARLAWQHMSLANIVEGDYTGTGLGNIIGVNVPEIVSGVAIAFQRWNLANTGYQYRLEIGAESGLNNALGYQLDGALSTDEAFYIDRKMDDGEAQTGFVRASSYSNYFNCVDSSDYTKYYFAYSGDDACNLMFLFKAK